MGRYNFDEVVNRRGTDSMKWDVKESELPMWVADMDFKTAPEIIAAFEKRIAHGVFGYSDVTEAWYEAYIGWWKRLHGLTMERDKLIFCTGVVPAISSIVRKLTTPNETVLVQTPVYNIFFNSIVNNGCRPLESPLKYEGGEYSMDFEDLERKMADPQCMLMILCNPHNPVGKIWSREELARVGALARKYHVTVISDEIHCDITRPGCEYVPFASVSDDCRAVGITCIAPTKTFNLAGMQSAAVYVPDELLHHKVWRGLNTDEVAEPNSFACLAAITAFNEGSEWIKELREYLFGNVDYAREYIEREIPGAKAVKSDATYLLWIDISSDGRRSDDVAALIREKTGLYISAGTAYGTTGESFLRMNLACPRVTVEEGLKRLKAGLAGL